VPATLATFDVGATGRDGPAGGARLDAAMAEVGACYVRDPGLPPAVLAPFAGTTADFFRRPAAEKEALAAQGPGTFGYRRPGSGAYAAAGGAATTSRDRCELFKVGAATPAVDGDGGDTGGPPGWTAAAPAMCAAWRSAYSAFEGTARAVADRLSTAAGSSDPGVARWMDGHASNLAVNWYPGDDPGEPTDRGGLRGAHTDFGPFTLLHHPGGVDGLDVEVDGRWIAAPPRPGHLILLLGDLLAFATGGHWRAPRHRVSAPTTSGPRMSVVFFVFPDPATVVTAADTGEAVAAGDFVAERLRRVYA
jgi:isopenicillin N synthase-like dioxygenase